MEQRTGATTGTCRRLALQRRGRDMLCLRRQPGTPRREGDGIEGTQRLSACPYTARSFFFLFSFCLFLSDKKFPLRTMPVSDGSSSSYHLIGRLNHDSFYLFLSFTSLGFLSFLSHRFLFVCVWVLHSHRLGAAIVFVVVVGILLRVVAVASLLILFS